MSYEKYKVDVPEGVSGDWEVSRFTVNREAAAFEAMRAAFSSSRGRGVPEGDYTQLTCRKSVIMSDTPDEIRDHFPIINRAKGRVLIGGLGLGMVAQAVLNKPEVTHVTIIDNSPDVIALVAPWLREKFGDRVEVQEADVLAWKPPKGARWSAAWWDIWPTITEDNLADMALLHRRFGTKVDWQGSWCKERILDERARNKRRGSWW